MLKNIIKSVLVLFLVTFGFKAHAYDDGDFQIWHTQNQEVAIGKGTKLVQEEEWRFGENASEFYYQHYDWGAVYGFDKRLDIGLHYRQVYEKNKKKWREENRPHVNATLKFDLWGLKLDDRNRIEYRHFRYKNDFIRYRNRLTIKYPFDFKGIKVSPYLSDEIFISSNSTGFNENRFYAGAECGLTKYVKFDIYYLLKENKLKDSKWSSANVLGTKVKIIF
ncbi:MAG: DUF2490 domain-containing protein [Candidatus Omnitrophica bacterium]|nr:DUF2490 domain-containing protein [Candidatus Omnitrophota bacterium]